MKKRLVSVLLAVCMRCPKYSLRPTANTELALRAYTVDYTLGDPIAVF